MNQTEHDAKTIPHLSTRRRVINFLRATNPRNLWLTLGVLVFGLVFTVLASLYVKADVEAAAQHEFDFICNEIQLHIANRLNASAQLLHGGAGLFDATETVTREDWRVFTQHFQIEEQLPGIQGIGFALLIPPEQLDQHIQEIRSEGFPGYTVTPAGERDIYSSIIFLEPFLDRNLRAFGYDMFSEPIRRAAMEQARDENIAVLSGKVILVQETGQDVQAGTLMYLPVYRHGMPIDTVEQRRAAILGWVYSPYRMTDMMNGTLDGLDVRQKERQIALQIYDGDVLSTDTLLYDSQSAADKALASTASISKLTSVNFAGRRWTLRFSQPGGLASTADYSSFWLVLLGGTSISLLLFGLTVSLLRTRVNARRMAEQLTAELRESEEKYRVVFHNEIYAICIFDLETLELLDVNGAYTQLYGYSREELISGMTIHDITAEHQVSDAATTRATREGTIFIPLRYHRKKDGVVFPVEIVGGPYVWQGRKVMFALAHDISARKQAENALGEKEKMLEQMIIFTEELLKTGSDQVTYPKILENLIFLSKAKYGVLTLLDESTGKYTTVAVAGMKDNLKKVSKIMGFELVGKEWNNYSTENEKLKGQIVSHFSSMSELTGSVVPEIIVKTIAKLIDMGEVAVIKVIAKNQVIGDFTLIMSTGKRFENDALIEIYSRQIDMFITRIKAEDQLNASEEKYRTVADFAYDWEAWRAPNGTYLYVSPSCERISGHTAAEFIADSNLIAEITHPDDQAAVIAHFHESGNGSRKQDLSLDLRIITAKGEIRWINHCCTAVFGESGLWLGRRESNRDITERKQAEQALLEAHDLLEQRVQERTAELSAANLDLEKAARMKDEFLASMSHELRTPLTGILGLSEVMQMPHIGSLNEKQSSYLTNIHKSGQRLLVIINDMLDYSMIESGKVNLSLNPCSLEEICLSSLQLTESQAAAKGLQSSLSIIPESIVISADARRLQKILVNLLGNAVKFTPKNGSFGIEARGDRTVGQVQITVWDNGIGIQEQDLPRLFQPFIQLDARLARQYEGTGLGLAMVRRLTELHGGSVSVQSAPGQGSRFTVTLPWQGVDI